MAEYTEIHDVIVSNERLEKSVMAVGVDYGESQTYRATVTDENGNPLPENFCVRLMIKPVSIGGEPSDLPPFCLAEVCFAPDVYDRNTKEVAIAFTIKDTTLALIGCHDDIVAEGKTGEFIVYLEWDDQEFYIP